MFAIKIPSFITLAIFGLITFLSFQGSSALARRFRLHLVTMFGSVLVFCGLAFQPWLEFGFLNYINPTPEFLKPYIPWEIIKLLFEAGGIKWLSAIFHWFGFLTKLPVWLAIFIPSLSTFTRLAMLLPVPALFTGCLLILTAPLSPGGRVAKLLGGFLCGFALFSGLLLLVALPGLDAVDIHDNFTASLALTILGTELGNGPYFCLFGLFLQGIGGFIELLERREEPAPATCPAGV